MKTSTSLLALALLGATAASGYWLGTTRPQAAAPDGAPASAASAQASAQTPASPSAPQPRKLLYYRNPMGLADTSPTPRKDPMGMDYIAVYQGEDEAAGAGSPGILSFSTEKIQKLGVRTEAATRRPLGKMVRVAGRVEPDERRVFAITAKFEGYVERLYVNATGQPVARGQVLFEAYSPELLATQREYVIAVQGQRAMQDAGPDAQASIRQLAESSLARLRNWDLSPQQLAALTATGQAQRTISFPSPVAGVVSEKRALQGMRFMPGEVLYQVTDLSSVWVIADVTEQDIGLVRSGAAVRVTTTAYPNQAFNGRVTYIYPTMTAETRSIPVRVELANPGLRLKPAMFAQVELSVGGATPVLTVPDSAVIDTGTRRIVLVQVAPGRFEPRAVELGGRGEQYVELLKGVVEGEQVVVAANFLIDAESNLKAVFNGLGAPGAAPPAPAAATAAAPRPPAAPRRVVGHQAEGRVEDIDPSSGSLSLAHGPVASLKWPAMTMAFKAANASLLRGLAKGQAVRFEFVERQPGEYVVTSIAARAGKGAPPPVPRAPAAPAAAASHAGH